MSMTPETRQKLSHALKGKPWSEVRRAATKKSYGYTALHQWMNRHYPRTGRCEWCAKTDRKTDYATTRQGVYTENPADWLELCRRCHLAFDGRLGHMKGRTHSPEARAKIKAARALQPPLKRRAA